MNAPAPPEFAVELRGIRKSFGENRANSDVSLRVRPGTLHAVIGENGAGKSTALKILAGFVRPDAGEIWVDGLERRWDSPLEAARHGIGMVQQHFLLANGESVLDNVIFGAEPSRAPWLARFLRPIDRATAAQEVMRLAKAHGLALDPGVRVGELPVAQQQWVEIIRLLYRKTRILILDEPTAVLTPREADALLASLRELTARGASIMIITHKLREVMSAADEVTVLRAGRTVAAREAKSTSATELADLMVGHKIPALPAGRSAVADAAPVAAFRDFYRERDGVVVLNGVTLSVRPGEIVGVAGVQGNGQGELVHALLERSIAGRPAKGTRGELRAPARSRLAYVPEDRHHESLLLDASVLENFTLGLERDPRFLRHGFLDWDAARRLLVERIREFDIRGAAPEVPVRALSGGNQQKLVIARELMRAPGLIVAAEPTRGVDLGAVRFIHGKLLEARDCGAGVLVISSDLDEIRALSDRILVMFKGAIIREAARGALSEESLGRALGGINA